MIVLHPSLTNRLMPSSIIKRSFQTSVSDSTASSNKQCSFQSQILGAIVTESDIEEPIRNFSPHSPHRFINEHPQWQWVSGHQFCPLTNEIHVCSLDLASDPPHLGLI